MYFRLLQSPKIATTNGVVSSESNAIDDGGEWTISSRMRVSLVCCLSRSDSFCYSLICLPFYLIRDFYFSERHTLVIFAFANMLYVDTVVFMKPHFNLCWICTLYTEVLR